MSLEQCAPRRGISVEEDFRPENCRLIRTADERLAGVLEPCSVAGRYLSMQSKRAAQMSVNGTSQPCRTMSAIGGKADIAFLEPNVR
jgi:hypothetical protein